MKVVFQIIRNHNTQELPAIIIFFEANKYVFNVPETFQRFLKFHHFRMSKSSKIFLTRLGTENITGLFGFLLTMYETSTCFDTKLYGPKDFIQYIESIKFLMGFKYLPYSCYSFDEKAQNKRENTLLGFKRVEVIEKLVQSKTYLEDFYNIEGFIKRELNNDEKELNDAAEYIDFDKNLYRDENMTIIPVIFQLDSASEMLSNQAQCINNISDLLSKPICSKTIISYICITRPPELKIVKEKLASYNLNKQQTSELMKTGETKLYDGKVLYKKDVQDNAAPCAVIMIIDCPNEEIAEKLVKNSIFDRFAKNQIDCKQYHVQSIIHMTPINVLQSNLYQAFMRKFDCEHVFTNSELFQIENPAKLPLLQINFKHMRMIETLNHYFPDYFPDIYTNSAIHEQFFQSIKDITEKNHAKIDINSLFKDFERKSLVKLNHQCSLIPIKPGFEPINTDIFPLKKMDTLDENKDFMQKYTKFLNLKKKSENEANKNMNFNDCDPLIVFLGTGSMIPSTYRNVSGIYLDYGSFSLLMDCGEGTYFQLLNQFGFERVYKEILPKLNILFISHIHVDHHAGLFQILYQRAKSLKALQVNPNDNPIFLVLPANLMPWYYKYTKYIEDFQGVKLVLTQSLGIQAAENQENMNKQGSFSKNFMYTSESMELEYYEDPLMKPLIEAIKASVEGNLEEFMCFLKKQGINEFLPVFVDHCPQAHGLVITHVSGVKIVYSGDTRPCDALVKYGMNATILIHEATFNDSLVKNAQENMHSTVGQAVFIAQKMKVWRLILTHFSQRFTKNVLKKEEKEQIKKNNKEYYDFLKNRTVFAYDHLSGKTREFEFLPWMSHCIANMSEEE